MQLALREPVGAALQRKVLYGNGLDESQREFARLPSRKIVPDAVMFSAAGSPAAAAAEPPAATVSLAPIVHPAGDPHVPNHRNRRMPLSAGTDLLRQIRDIGREAGADALAVLFHDYESGAGWSLHADRPFHAASTIKVPLLLAVFGAIHEERLDLLSRVHVRNRFRSAADDAPFRVGTERDANAAVHAARGRTMRVQELARHMIVTSSNLATNLLLDVVGVEAAQATLAELGLEGVELLRGVEDERAWEQGVNNRVTARGLGRCFRLLAERRAFTPELSDAMLEILFAQEFNSGIPAGLPPEARVAHKTGEISTVAHDAGIVYLPEREPYVLVVLSEWQPDRGGRHDAIARVSRAVYESLGNHDGGNGDDG